MSKWWTASREMAKDWLEELGAAREPLFRPGWDRILIGGTVRYVYDDNPLYARQIWDRREGFLKLPPWLMAFIDKHLDNPAVAAQGHDVKEEMDTDERYAVLAYGVESSRPLRQSRVPWLLLQCRGDSGRPTLAEQIGRQGGQNRDRIAIVNAIVNGRGIDDARYNEVVEWKDIETVSKSTVTRAHRAATESWEKQRYYLQKYRAALAQVPENK